MSKNNHVGHKFKILCKVKSRKNFEKKRYKMEITHVQEGKKLLLFK